MARDLLRVGGNKVPLEFVYSTLRVGSSSALV